MEFFLAGDLLGDVELAADLIGGVEQRHLMAAAGGGGGKGQPGGAGADHRQLFGFSAMVNGISVSRQARGLTVQDVSLPSKIWSRQARCNRYRY